MVPRRLTSVIVLSYSRQIHRQQQMLSIHSLSVSLYPTPYSSAPGYLIQRIYLISLIDGLFIKKISWPLKTIALLQ